MAITNLQQARQMYALGQRVAKTMDGSRPGYRGPGGYQGNGSGPAGGASAGGNYGGDSSGGVSPNDMSGAGNRSYNFRGPADLGVTTRSANTISPPDVDRGAVDQFSTYGKNVMNQSLDSLRSPFGFTDAARTNLLSPRSLATTAFGALIGIPGLGFLSNLNVNPTSTVPYDLKTRGGEGIIPILPTTFTDYYANVDVDDDETVDEVQDFISRFQGADETLNSQAVGLQDTDKLRAMIQERVKNLYT